VFSLPPKTNRITSTQYSPIFTGTLSWLPGLVLLQEVHGKNQHLGSAAKTPPSTVVTPQKKVGEFSIGNVWAPKWPKHSGEGFYTKLPR